MITPKILHAIMYGAASLAFLGIGILYPLSHDWAQLAAKGTAMLMFFVFAIQSSTMIELELDERGFFDETADSD